MNRDELLTRLAMEMPEWPSGLNRYQLDKIVSPIIPSDHYQGSVDDCGKSEAYLLGWDITRYDWIAERERLINKPSWDEAPKWANWLAQDKDGEWCFFPEQPEKMRRMWSHSAAETGVYVKSFCEGRIPQGHRWQDTLEQRPVTQTADPVAEDDEFRQCERRLREAELTRHIAPAELVNRQLMQRCEELQESNARLVDENQRLRRIIGELCA